MRPSDDRLDLVLRKTLNSQNEKPFHIASGDIANALPAEFVRIHRSFIINMRHIDEVQSNEVLIGKELYPISRNYREEIFKKLGDRKLL